MRLAAIACLFLVACSGDKQPQMLEAEYGQAVTSKDQCRIATKIAETYLKRSDEKNYKDWSLTRDIDCLHAETAA